ncbi:hypothetical protein COM13_18945 [Bacillus pseudomycoides]|uniref:HAD-IIIC family phosphatase n=1 Tax=Bacillus TaxID=1386 RepID=UPI000361BDD3|nr:MULTISPECIES: HAD-IIIC family phosphatase [Bacillus]PDX99228.1 hypothetical protein COO07_17555 [Bacillus pseudomycoides]PEK80742.1 hypothetical protein CN597_10035 [Bacillus pseudomycoides]PEN08114.1 hypothetical protein CN640_13850 [Bacillus pseudomycoides]PGB87543.1 hypothetical protein COM13_18945 [Bacillus pseudomycoides]PGS04529.1 hypothetical protein COC54_12635 [Bacillus pseudomycoides]
MTQEKLSSKKIKCLVWDLDNTLWNGTLIEDSHVEINPKVISIIKKLDERGILQSIASKNDYTMAMEKIEELGISEYFLYPQIHWNSKSESINKIAEELNINIDTIAFIDDQQFELDEVKYNISEVTCLNATEIDNILENQKFIPRFITEDSKKRRLMYKQDKIRKEEERNFKGTEEEFLAGLQMKLAIGTVEEGDLQRAEELTVRTNQLNSTGYTYSYEELDYLRKSDNHKLFIVDLRDKYGDYGKTGLALIKCSETKWTIKLLLMSCRVMSRGIGTVLMTYIMKLAKENSVTVEAEFVENKVNRMMFITYKFSGFKEVAKEDNKIILHNDLSFIQPFPQYIDIKISEKDTEEVM